MNHQARVLSKLEDKSAVIGIVGLGYVGLPLVLRFSEEGYRVLGIDIDGEKVAALNRLSPLAASQESVMASKVPPMQ